MYQSNIMQTYIHSTLERLIGSIIPSGHQRYHQRYDQRYDQRFDHTKGKIN